MSAGPATAHRSSTRPARRTPAPRAPRRVSGPARARARTTPARPAARSTAVALPRPLAPRAVEALVRLPDSRWLDRLLRGRAWIALIGVALMGLVFMQVSMLRMNTGIGRSVERSAELERANADLRATVSQLSSEERIQREAAAMGLLMPAAGDVRYVTSRGPKADARRASKIMREPSPAALQQEQLAAAGALPAAGTDPAAPAPGVTAGETAPAPTAPVDPAAHEAHQAAPAATEPAPGAVAPEQTASAPTAPQAAERPVAQQAPAPVAQQQPPPAANGAAVAPTPGG